MKLTTRGRDFVRATVAGTLAATVVDIRIVLTLCLSLVFVALISEVILALSSAKNLKITPESSQVSCFKGEEIKCNLTFHAARRRLVSVSLSKLTPPQSVEAAIEKSDPGTLSLRLKPKFAGRFSGLSAQFELKDPFQLFSKTIDFTPSAFVLDCYPISILKEIVPSRPLSIALGELQGTSQGTGSEFYAVDEYRGVTESRNIFWKKVASMPDERLLVKVRVANIQKVISIALLHTINREKNSSEWIDSVCEGVGSLGKAILQIGCDVEIKFDDGVQVVTERASDLRELSEAIMMMSTSHESGLDNTSSILTAADICVTGFGEIQNGLIASAVARKPALLIKDEGIIPAKIGVMSVVYGQYKNLGLLVNRVVGT